MQDLPLGVAATRGVVEQAPPGRGAGGALNRPVPSKCVSDARCAGTSVAPAEPAGVQRPVEPMQFLWPHNLWWMLVLPLLPALYLWLLRRARKPARMFSSLRVVREAAGRRWRRHVAPALIFLALALLLLALARPTAPVPLLWAKSTILLAIDISRSMRVADVQPTRMVAAQEAAKGRRYSQCSQWMAACRRGARA